MKLRNYPFAFIAIVAAASAAVLLIGLLAIRLFVGPMG